MTVRSLGYVIVETTDLPAWQRFANDVIGLMNASSADPSVSLFRLDDRPFRLWVQKSERNGFGAAGWEFGSAEELAAVIQRLQQAGCAVERASVMEARARQVNELARTVDPVGNRLELFYGRFCDYAPFVSPAAVSGFVTGDTGELGLGHVVLTAPEFENTHRFYKDLLGFADTDLGRFYLAGGGPDDAGVGFAFMHAKNRRHHSLALGQMPESPNGAVHLMLEVATVDDVGRAYDKVLKGAAPLSATLGRHANDKMLSFYVRTPSGFDIEYGCHGMEIDPATWLPTTSLPVSSWGHEWQRG